LDIDGNVVGAVEGPLASVVYVCAAVAHMRGDSKRPLQQSKGLDLVEVASQ
jgi:hypothetical protein